VIEAFGRGNLPSRIVPDIKAALEKNILWLLFSRTYTGRVLTEYDMKVVANI
jgi:L-asparaginase/Glu-tRNA(Gln) amidotransferase subunit D